MATRDPRLAPRTLAVAAVALAIVGCGHAGPIAHRGDGGSAGGVGSVRVEDMTAESDIAYEVAVAGVTVPRQWWVRTWWTREIETLATVGDRVTRARVTYRRHGTTSRMSGADQVDERGLLAGRSFVVDAGTGTLVITGDDGAEVGGRIAAQVRADLRWVGVPDAIGVVLAHAPLQVGDRIPIDESVMAATFGDVPPDRFHGAATVRGFDVAVDGTRLLELELELAAGRDDDGRFRIANRLDGTLVIDVTHRRAIELTLAGPIRRYDRIARHDRAVVGDGAGRARMRWTASYR